MVARDEFRPSESRERRHGEVGLADWVRNQVDNKDVGARITMNSGL